MSTWRKLGLVAGGGELPIALAEHLSSTGREFYVSRVKPYADPPLDAFPGSSHDLGAVGARIAGLREAGCDAIVFVGRVPRPDFTLIEWDDTAKAMLEAMGGAENMSDDQLLRALIIAHVQAGFAIVGADDAMADLLAPAGVWGAYKPSDEHMSDIRLAAKVAHALGVYDVAQGVVVASGLVLALEAQEGTDAMLRRVAELPPAVRGSAQARRGALVKRPKPKQERRIDLPTIGVRTIEGAIAAGLSGIAVEADAALAVRRDAIVAAADAAGLFVYGFTAAEIDAA